jgi:uncharacterized protein (TIGR02145 family)
MKFVEPSCSDNANCAGAGTKLKATSGWNAYAGIPAGTDEHGFSALPGGRGSSGVYFDNVGNTGHWWSANEYDSGRAYYRVMYYNFESADYSGTSKDYLFSVRCVQD